MSASLKHPTVDAVLAIHEQVLAAHGGATGIRSRDLLESAVAAPQATKMGALLISDPIEIAAAYLFYLCGNHPFVDGNKRAGHAVLETFLMLNGYEISARVDEQAEIVLGVASGKIDRHRFTDWLKAHIVELP